MARPIMEQPVWALRWLGRLYGQVGITSGLRVIRTEPQGGADECRNAIAHQLNEKNTSGGRILRTSLLIRWPAMYPPKVLAKVLTLLDIVNYTLCNSTC
jgi:hypothetical protein